MPKDDSDKSSTFPSWQGRSGLDPVDTSRIAASAEGVFLRRLFTFKVRTRNLFSLLVMLILGVGATGLTGLTFYTMATTPIAGKPDFTDYLILVVFYSILGLILLVGIALLLNFGINVGIALGLMKVGSSRQQGQRTKETKKKTPKRRKDFK